MATDSLPGEYLRLASKIFRKKYSSKSRRRDFDEYPFYYYNSIKDSVAERIATFQASR